MTPTQYTALATKYRHIIKAMQYVAILAQSEAVFAIRDYKTGEDYSGEAVNHFGGIRATIRQAYKMRHIIAKIG